MTESLGEGNTLEITVASQTWIFLCSLLMGAAIGLFYDVFRILRVAFCHNDLAVLIEDILFWTISAAATFFFFLGMDDGRIRICLLLGEGIGFVLYYFTIGVLVLGTAKRIIAVIRWILRLLFRVFIAPILFVLRKIAGFLYRVQKKIVFSVKKQAKKSNSHLKKCSNILYNQRKQVHEAILRKKKKKGSLLHENSQDKKTEE